jgi:hypothetical protein
MNKANNNCKQRRQMQIDQVEQTKQLMDLPDQDRLQQQYFPR